MLYLWNSKHGVRKPHNRSKVHIRNQQTGETWCQIEKTGAGLNETSAKAPSGWKICKNCEAVREESLVEPSLAVLMGEHIA